MLLDYGFPFSDNSKSKLLHFACISEDVNTVKSLLEKGFNVPESINNGESFVTLVSTINNQDLLKVLLSYNVDVLLCDHDVKSPHNVACEHGNVDVTILLQHRADVFKSDGNSPLHITCKKTSRPDDRAKIFRILLEYIAKVNTCDEDGDYPLHLACRNGNSNIVKLLLANQAYISVVNFHGESPLYIACETKDLKIVNLLLKCKNDSYKADRKQLSPLCLACRRKDANLLQLLLKSNTNTAQCDMNGRTPMHVACEMNDYDFMTLLLEYNADIFQNDDDSMAPFHVMSKTCMILFC